MQSGVCKEGRFRGGRGRNALPVGQEGEGLASSSAKEKWELRILDDYHYPGLGSLSSRAVTCTGTNCQNL